MISFLLFHQPAWHNRGSKRPLLLQARQRAGSLIPALGPSFWRDQIQGHRHGHKFQGQQWDTAEQPLGDRHLDLARRGPACTPCSLRAKLSRLRKGNPVWSQSAIFFFFSFLDLILGLFQSCSSHTSEQICIPTHFFPLCIEAQ